ncbi:MAG: hypothetical protein DRJ42_00665 [Deltaproteobacteria bacterium]|nr:MAG: hypothetical protein DRJ42_00665 [Deltaproteobacteria bacterium]
MSETPTLTVPTAFNDISQLAEGMSDRVDDERLMLYGPDAVEENSWLRFSILLMDQSVALEGVGRAVASIDGGAERPEVARYDIVLDNLQLEGMSEVVYERMLAYRAGAFDGPATGEVSADAVAAAEAAAAEAPAGEEMFGEVEEESTMVASADEYAEHVAASEVQGAADAEDAADVQDVPDAEEAQEVPQEITEDVPDAGYAEMEGQGPTVVAQALSEDDPGASPEAAPEAYEDAGPTEVFADHEDHEDVGEAAEAAFDEAGPEHADAAAVEDVDAEAGLEDVAEYATDDDIAEADVDGYEPAATESEGFADAHTDDVEAPPAEDWGTSEIDLANVEDIADIDAPPSAPLPEAPTAPPGFTLEQMNGALTRQSHGATWEPNLALAPEPRAPSGLFAYGGELPVPGRAPRPDLDPSDCIQPAPRPVEPGAAVAVADGQEVQEAVEYAEEAEEAVEVAAEEYAEEAEEAVEVAAEEFAAPDDAAAFDDAGTEVESAEPPVEAFDEPLIDSDDAETRMDVELPE